MLIQEQMGVRGVVNLMAFVILISSFAAADSRSNEIAQEQSQLNAIGGSEDINDDMAELLWTYCRLDLKNAKESVEDLELYVSGSNEIDSCRLCTEEIIEKALSAVDPQLMQTVLNCLRKINIRPDAPKRRKLVQIFAEEPVQSPPEVTSPNVDPPCTSRKIDSTHRNSGYSRHFSDSSRQHITVVERASKKKKKKKKGGGGDQTVVVAAAVAAAGALVSLLCCICCCCRGGSAKRKDEAPLLSLSMSNSSAGSSRKSFANSVNKDNPGNKSLKMSFSFNDNFYLESDIIGEAEDSTQVPPSLVKNPNGTQLSSLKPPLTTQASLKPHHGRLESQQSTSKPPHGKLGSQTSSHKPHPEKLISAGNEAPLPPPHGNGAAPPPPPGSGGAPLPPPPSSGPAPPPPPGAPRPPPTAGPPPPPPPRGGAGPRPPPPPGGGGPPPPPGPRPPGARPSPSGAPPLPGMAEVGPPKTKLKPFFWDKVTASNDQAMVWHELKAGSFQFNEEMIESLFGYNAENTNKNAAKKESSSQDSGSQFIQIIDQKKSQNLAILLKALNVTTDEVCDALQEGTELPSELIRTLIKMAPTAEEELKLRLYNGDRSRLGTAEQFLKVIVDIPFAFKRMESLLFMRTLQDEASLLKDSFVTLEAACTELRNSRLFLKLLEAVLKTGNRMNVGTYRGSAQAFKLDTLLKLSDVKGSDGKITLLHFVVQEIIRSEGVRAARLVRESQSSISSVKFEDLLDEDPMHDSEEYLRELGLQVVSGLGNDLENVKKAAVLDADSITGTVSDLGHSLIKARDFLNTDMKNVDEETGFHKTLKSFIQNAEGDIIWLLEEEKRIMALVKSTADYFHGNAKKDEGLRLFVIVRDFLIILDKACKEVKSTPRKPKAQKKDDSNEPARQSVSDNPFEPARQSVSDNPFEPARQSVSKNPFELPRPSVSESPRPPVSDNRQRLVPAIAERRVDSSSSSDDDSS